MSQQHRWKYFIRLFFTKVRHGPSIMLKLCATSEGCSPELTVWGEINKCINPDDTGSASPQEKIPGANLTLRPH